MKLVQCFLFSLYASLDDKWMNDNIHHISQVDLCTTILVTLAGYLCGELYNLFWYTPDEITQISLLFILLYHLHPKTRKFDFLHDIKKIPIFLLISINDFGFGILANLQQLPLSALICFKACIELFLISVSMQSIQSKWFSITMIVLMLIII